MSGSVRKIAVFTGGRAEYGLLKPILSELGKKSGIDFGLFVTAAHLSHEYGYTVSHIEQDGFPIWARFESLISSDSPTSVCKSMALGCMGVSEALSRHQPDLLVLLGDRYELLAAAQAALIHKVPVAHIHGGEITQGAIDDAIRHAITKMSHLHFVATEQFRDRVVQLGEDKNKVYVVGAPGLDNVKHTPLMTREELSADLGMDLKGRYFVVTYHPVTLGERPAGDAVAELTAAFSEFPEEKFIITYPNSDPGNSEIIAPLAEFAEKKPDHVVLCKSLGLVRYLSAVKNAAAVVGNSSSGIIEVPSFGVPTLNIGERQNGRPMSDSIIQCREDKEDIIAAMKQALSPSFMEQAKNCHNVYGDGSAARRIADTLATTSLDGLLVKRFTDIANPEK